MRSQGASHGIPGAVFHEIPGWIPIGIPGGRGLLGWRGSWYVIATERLFKAIVVHGALWLVLWTTRRVSSKTPLPNRNPYTKQSAVNVWIASKISALRPMFKRHVQDTQIRLIFSFMYTRTFF